MSRADRTRHQGFILPDLRLSSVESLWADESSYTEGNARAGVPAPNGDYELVVQAAGKQATGQDYTLRLADGGSPRGLTSSCGLVYRDGLETGAFPSSDYLGWEAPASITSFEFVTFGAVPPALGALAEDYHPSVVVLKGSEYYGRHLVASENTDGGLTLRYRDGASGAWTSVDIHTPGSTGVDARRPCLLEIDGSVYCYAFCRGPSASADEYGIRTWISRNGGEGWQIAREYSGGDYDIQEATPTINPARYSFRFLRAAYAAGQVMLVAGLYKGGSGLHHHCLRQYASFDNGVNLQQVQTWDPTERQAGPADVVSVGDRFVVLYVDETATLKTIRTGSAFDPLTLQAGSIVSSATWNADLGDITFPSGQDSIVGGDLAACVDDHGTIWAYPRRGTGPDDAGSFLAVFSEDSGATFQAWGRSSQGPQDAAHWFEGIGGGTIAGAHPLNVSACWHEGRALVACNHEPASASATDRGGSLSICYLGGASNLTLPPIKSAQDRQDRATYNDSQLPFEQSKDHPIFGSPRAYTENSTTFTSTLSQTGEQLTSGNGSGTAGYIYFTRTDPHPGGDVAFIGEITMEAVTGIGSAFRKYVAFSFRIDDGTQGIEASIRAMSTGQFTVHNDVTNTQLELVSPGYTGANDYRAGMFLSADGSRRELRVWYRQHSTEAEREWIYVGSYTLSADSGTVGNNQVAYGNQFNAGAGNTSQSRFLRKPAFTFASVNSASDSSAGCADFWHEWLAVSDNPHSLSPFPLSASFAPIPDGPSLRAQGGPGHRAETWSLTAGSDTPVARVFPSESRSPRVRWHTDDETQAEIAWRYDAGVSATTESAIGYPLLGMSVRGCNWRSAELYRVTSSGDVLEATIDSNDPIGNLSVTRVGGTLAPAADSDFIFYENELRGWFVRFPGGIVRRIRGNSRGRWASTGGAGPRARFILEGADGTEPTSGSVQIWPPDFTFLFHVEAGASAVGWKLRILSQDTVDGHFQTGVIIPPSPVYVSGYRPGRGRSMAFEDGPTIAVDDARIGRRRVRNPARRILEVAWQDGVPTGPLFGDQEPAWVATTSTGSVDGTSYPAATAYDLVHAYTALEKMPVVWCVFDPSDGSADEVMLTRGLEHMYGTLDEDITLQDTYGDEYRSELLTVSRVTLREEV